MLAVSCLQLSIVQLYTRLHCEFVEKLSGSLVAKVTALKVLMAQLSVMGDQGAEAL